MTELVLHVPSMTCRHVVRVVSGALSDVPGVRTVAVDMRTASVTVTGWMTVEAARTALHAAGHPADIPHHR